MDNHMKLFNTKLPDNYDSSMPSPFSFPPDVRSVEQRNVRNSPPKDESLDIAARRQEAKEIALRTLMIDKMERKRLGMPEPKQAVTVASRRLHLKREAMRAKADAVTTGRSTAKRRRSDSKKTQPEPRSQKASADVKLEHPVEIKTEPNDDAEENLPRVSQQDKPGVFAGADASDGPPQDHKECEQQEESRVKLAQKLFDRRALDKANNERPEEEQQKSILQKKKRTAAAKRDPTELFEESQMKKILKCKGNTSNAVIFKQAPSNLKLPKSVPLNSTNQPVGFIQVNNGQVFSQKGGQAPPLKAQPSQGHAAAKSKATPAFSTILQPSTSTKTISNATSNTVKDAVKLHDGHSNQAKVDVKQIQNTGIKGEFPKIIVPPGTVLGKANGMMPSSLKGINLYNNTNSKDQIILRPIGIVTNVSSSSKPQFVRFNNSTRPGYPNSTNPRSLLPPPSAFSQSLLKPANSTLPVSLASSMTTNINNNKPAALSKTISSMPSLPASLSPSPDGLLRIPANASLVYNVSKPAAVPQSTFAAATTVASTPAALRRTNRRCITSIENSLEAQQAVDNADTDYKPFTMATMRKHARARSRSKSAALAAAAASGGAGGGGGASTTPAVDAQGKNTRRHSSSGRSTRAPARYINSDDVELQSALAASQRHFERQHRPTQPTAHVKEEVKEVIKAEANERIVFTQPRRATLFSKGDVPIPPPPPAPSQAQGRSRPEIDHDVFKRPSTTQSCGQSLKPNASNSREPTSSHVEFKKDTEVGPPLSSAQPPPQSSAPPLPLSSAQPQSPVEIVAPTAVPPPPFDKGPCVQYTSQGYSLLPLVSTPVNTCANCQLQATTSSDDLQSEEELVDGQPTNGEVSRPFTSEPYLCAVCHKGTGNCNSGELYGPLLHNTKFSTEELWVHTDCAVWCPEVFMTPDGSIRGLIEALVRLANVRCSVCQLNGANAPCGFAKCANIYHLNCADKSKCVIDRKKFTANCAHHPVVKPRPLTGEQLRKAYRTKKYIPKNKS